MSTFCHPKGCLEVPVQIFLSYDHFRLGICRSIGIMHYSKSVTTVRGYIICYKRRGKYQIVAHKLNYIVYYANKMPKKKGLVIHV